MTLTVGQKATRSLTLTAEHVQKYAEITGDYNPLHFDEDFAAATPFGRLVVQGGLTTGLLHALVAMDMPGPGTVFMSQEWKFTAPVFVDDTPAGHLTVCVYSPRLKQNLGFVMAKVEYATAGQKVEIRSPSGAIRATLCELPFIKDRKE